MTDAQAAALFAAVIGSFAMRIAVQVFCAVALGASAEAASADTLPHNPDMRPFVAAVDANHDGRMSHAEWAHAGAPESAFRSLDRTHRGYVTPHDLQVVPAPPGIDLNGDGKVTLAEFREFDRRHAHPAPAPKQ